MTNLSLEGSKKFEILAVLHRLADRVRIRMMQVRVFLVCFGMCHQREKLLPASFEYEQGSSITFFQSKPSLYISDTHRERSY